MSTKGEITNGLRSWGKRTARGAPSSARAAETQATLSDGCGHMLDCGQMCPTAGDTCGGGGTLNVCGHACVKATCVSLGDNCGHPSDGCGGTLDCGGCFNAGELCGGGGTPFVCGRGCVKVTCAEFALDCGMIPDGCGGMLSCGSCIYPKLCAGQGTPNRCETCPTLTTCMAQGKNCGFIADGCTGMLDCGSCNAPQSCGGGGMANVCGEGTHNLAIVSGDKQMGLVGQQLMPVLIAVQDATTGSAAPNVPMTYTAPTGGAVIPPSGVTDRNGQATVTLVLPHATGTFTYTATADKGGSISIAATAKAPTNAGTVPLLNQLHVAGVLDGVPGPGSQARFSTVLGGIALAGDGTMYFADSNNHAVLALQPSGNVIVVAGGNGYGSTGDYGPGTKAQLDFPTGVALDLTGRTLFIADTYNHRVRALDVTMSNGNIVTYAGGGPQNALFPYGDGGPANQATLTTPQGLSVGPDGALYLFSTGSSSALRRVDPVTNVISTVVPGVNYGTVNCFGPLVFLTCNNNAGPGLNGSCNMAWDAAGNLFFTGYVCGGPFYNNSANVVFRRAPDGTLAIVAGGGQGLPGDGQVASAVSFGGLSGVALDQGGNIYFSETSANRIRKIDGTTDRLSTVIGGANGTAGYAGDYQPPSMGLVSGPGALFMDPGGSLYFADSGNATVRMISKLGKSTADGARLSVVTASDAQRLYVGQLVNAPLAALLADGAGHPLPGQLVNWSVVDAGGGLTAPNAYTDANGISSVAVRPGLAAGTYHFQASYSDVHGMPVSGSPAIFSTIATAPPAGTVYPLVNAYHVIVSTLSGLPAAAPLVRVGYVSGIAAASDGTIYFSDLTNQAVLQVTPAGVVSVLAGNNSYGYGGDFGPAAQAKLYSPRGLLLDEPSHLLYLADSSNNMVRVIDLDPKLPTPIIRPVAGGGVNPPAYGDGGPATAAQLSYPNQLSLGPDGALYIGDTQHNMIRRVDPVSKFISTFVPYASGCTNASTYFSWCGDGYQGCGMTWYGGELYISGGYCSTSGSLYGIVKRTAAGGFVGVAGMYGAAAPSPDGTAPLATGFSTLSSLQIDAAGLLTFSEIGESRIRRFDVTRPMAPVTTIIGSTGGGYSGDYVPAAPATLIGYHAEISLGPGGHLLIADYDNGAIREIY